MEKTNDKQLAGELSFDLYGRHAIIRDIINLNRGGHKKLKVLDVGGMGNLMRRFLPGDEVFYLDPNVKTKDKNFIAGDGCDLPLENESFDFVVSADVFEHIPENKRERFLSEQLRVARLGVALAAPFYSKENAKAEALANENYKLRTGRDHVFLKEHLESGLPREEKLENFLGKEKIGFQKISNNGLFLWEILINAMSIASENRSPAIAGKIKDFNLFYNTHIYPLDFSEPAYRKVYFLKKKSGLKNLNVKIQPKSDKLLLEAIGRGFSIVNRINSETASLIQNKDREISKLEHRIGLEEEKTSALDRAIKERDRIIKERDRIIKERDRIIKQKETVLEEREKELKLIRSSKVWKARNLVKSVLQPPRKTRFPKSRIKN